MSSSAASTSAAAAAKDNESSTKKTSSTNNTKSTSTNKNSGGLFNFFKKKSDIYQSKIDHVANGKTWRGDPIEKAWRVWEWWRAKRWDASLHHFTWAARLVVLVQLSSASCERVFSQVKLIVETCGVSPLEETLETRLMERCNVNSIIN